MRQLIIGAMVCVCAAREGCPYYDGMKLLATKNFESSIVSRAKQGEQTKTGAMPVESTLYVAENKMLIDSKSWTCIRD